MLRCPLFFRNRLRNRIQQLADALPVLRTHRKHVADAEPAKILRFVGERLGLHLVDREEQGLASALEQARQIVVGPR